MMGIGLTELIIILVIVGPPIILVLFLVGLAIRRYSRQQSSQEELQLLREFAGRLDSMEQRLDSLESEVRGNR